ncbi:hypothetical protein MXB_4721 [Myxobolus squamalis]|nr:hypothetical protein MXB_4721 [Myxobolus squamalis]
MGSLTSLSPRNDAVHFTKSEIIYNKLNHELWVGIVTLIMSLIYSLSDFSLLFYTIKTKNE